MKVSKIKILRCALSTILLVFAGLQFNDPDPWRWVLLYGLVAVLGMVGSTTQNPGRVLISVVYLCVAWWRFPEVYHGVGEMDEYTPEIEQARESIGLLIASGINGINVWLFSVEESHHSGGK